MARIGYIQITRECNQACVICSNPENKRKASFSELKREIRDMKKNHFEEVILTGGEPTLYDRLPELIEYCCQIKVIPRIITNGQKIASRVFLENLKKSGLDHLHLSIYSYRKDIQAKISQNKESYANIKKALDNLGNIGTINTDINIAINKYNADHLSETVSWLIEKYTFINHFVFNNLDPYMNRASENIEVVPRLNDFELELHKSLVVLENNGKTFRVERVPLCYLSDFEHVSTETRKIVKKEDRMIYFLDKRGKVRQNKDNWNYKKSDSCRVCNLEKICAGLYAFGDYYKKEELYPVFVSKEDIIRKIVENE